MQAVLAITLLCLPREFHGIFTDEPERIVKNYYLFFCVASGLWGGLTIGLVTEYYTSNAYAPVKVGRVGVVCETGLSVWWLSNTGLVWVQRPGLPKLHLQCPGMCQRGLIEGQLGQRCL